MERIGTDAERPACVKFDWLSQGNAAHTLADRAAVLHSKDEEGMS